MDKVASRPRTAALRRGASWSARRAPSLRAGSLVIRGAPATTHTRTHTHDLNLTSKPPSREHTPHTHAHHTQLAASSARQPAPRYPSSCDALYTARIGMSSHLATPPPSLATPTRHTAGSYSYTHTSNGPHLRPLCCSGATRRPYPRTSPRHQLMPNSTRIARALAGPTHAHTSTETHT